MYEELNKFVNEGWRIISSAPYIDSETKLPMFYTVIQHDNIEEIKEE